MADTLEITDGTLTVDMANQGGNFHVKWGQWSPQKTELREQPFGNQDPYEEVQEKITLHITGTDADAVLLALEDIGVLITQARRWNKREPVDLVTFRYLPEDSTGTVLEAVVIGPPERGPSVSNPGDFDRLKDGRSINDVIVQFGRRGAMYGDTDTQSDTPSTQGIPASVTFSEDLRHLSPVTLTITGYDSPGALPSHFIVFVNDPSSDIVGIEGETGGVHSSQSDSANLASDGNVQRVEGSGSPPTAIENWTGFSALEHEIIGVIATFRVNSSSRTWKVRARTETASATINGQTEWVVIDGAESTAPQPVFLGYISSPGKDHSRLDFDFEADAGSSPTIDIDKIWLVGLDPDHNRILTIVNVDGVAAGIVDLVIDPRHLTGLEPIITAELVSTSNDFYLAWRGDAFLAAKGTTLGAVVICTDPDLGYWRLSDGSAVVDLAYQFDRQYAYPNPK